MRVATANVNGIRAAQRRGMSAWLDERQPDILCLQEVRASDAILTSILGDSWSGIHEECSTKGRAGVAILARIQPTEVRAGLTTSEDPEGEFTGAGRWVEADFAIDSDGTITTGTGEETLTVVSVYVHTGEAETPRQDEKYRFLAAVRARMSALAADGRNILVCGDFNVAHREVDIKNWKGNLTRAGFLPEERAWFDQLFDEDGFVDVHRALAGEGPGPYTWWSWRGKAFDVDSGWRIDYQIATAELATGATQADVDRADSYAQRWSDHAPVVVDYEYPRHL